MSQRPPRPRAFRLDDRRVAVDDQPAATRRGGYSSRSTSRFPPPPRRADRRSRARDRGGAEIGPDRPLALDARAPRVDRARRPRLARARIVGDEPDRGRCSPGRSRSDSSARLRPGCSWSASSASRRARSSRSARQTRIAEMHVAFARARAADDRDAARRCWRSSIALYRDRPETARARAEVEDAPRAIIDGRDLIDVAERALLEADRREGGERDRRRRRAGVAGDGDQPARGARRRIRGRPDRCAWSGGSPKSTAAGQASSA